MRNTSTCHTYIYATLSTTLAVRFFSYSIHLLDELTWEWIPPVRHAAQYTNSEIVILKTSASYIYMYILNSLYSRYSYKIFPILHIYCMSSRPNSITMKTKFKTERIWMLQIFFQIFIVWHYENFYLYEKTKFVNITRFDNTRIFTTSYFENMKILTCTTRCTAHRFWNHYVRHEHLIYTFKNRNGTPSPKLTQWDRLA